ncbi:MAG TPA: S46 family peptidase, partial [Oceanospirillales bacterium]|nr:S46 family peptidase [Oceanospirillales bacterium]
MNILIILSLGIIIIVLVKLTKLSCRFTKMFKNRLILLLLFLSSQLLAVEGMWQPHQLMDLSADLKAKGLQIPVENISKLDKFPMTAMVSLGFCSASFVSESGLIITNHHCAYGAVQYNSSKDNNLIDKGFYAKNLNDELPAGPGTYIYVTQDIKDVSAEIIKQLVGLHGQARYDKYESIEKKMLATCENKPVYRCSLRVFHGGLKYYLIKQLQIKDVRLVYAPADSIGKYGGDIDNWMWPRHTGDFSFLRAYVSKSGQSVAYNKDNVPYHSKDFLTVNANGIKSDDFVMILGYPGRTSRHRLAQEVENSVLWHYPMIIKNYTKYIELVEQEAKKRPEVGIKYASSLAGVNNYLKNSQGMLDGFRNPQLIKDKQKKEDDFFNWIVKNDNKKAGHALQMLKKLLDKKKQHRDRNFYIGQVKRSQLLSAANKLYRLAKEKSKADAERKPYYQKRNWDRIKNSLVQIDRRFDAKMDRILTEYALNQYAELADDERSKEFDKLFHIKGDGKDSKRIAKALDKLYKNTELGNKTKRLSWLDAKASAIEKSKDSML